MESDFLSNKNFMQMELYENSLPKKIPHYNFTKAQKVMARLLPL